MATDINITPHANVSRRNNEFIYLHSPSYAHWFQFVLIFPPFCGPLFCRMFYSARELSSTPTRAISNSEPWLIHRRAFLVMPKIKSNDLLLRKFYPTSKVFSHRDDFWWRIVATIPVGQGTTKSPHQVPIISIQIYCTRGGSLLSERRRWRK